jgi:hyperosmotically inducible protein
MTYTTSRKFGYRQTLIAAGLTAALGLGGMTAAIAAEPGDATPHSDGIGAAISDTAITAKVKAKFVGDDRLKHSHISVTTTNGVVTLSGTAPDTDASTAAATLARSVDGVKSVDDELSTVQASDSSVKAETKRMAHTTKRVVTDSWITTKVKSAILADSVSKGFEVSVKTKHGVVMLDGTLANQDAIDHVKDLAKNIEGVKSVNAAGLKVQGNS